MSGGFAYCRSQSAAWTAESGKAPLAEPQYTRWYLLTIATQDAPVSPCQTTVVLPSRY